MYNQSDILAAVAFVFAIKKAKIAKNILNKRFFAVGIAISVFRFLQAVYARFYILG